MELLKKLTGVRGVSGHESRAGIVFKELLSEYTKDIKEDALGNITGKITSGIENAKKLLIEAHIDELGLMITGIEERGFLTFTPVGGTDVKILPGCEVTVHGKKDIYGVVGAKPPHLIKDGEDKGLNINIMSIDTGLENISELVSVGDIATYNAGFINLAGDFAVDRAFDDRAGLAVLLKALAMIKNPKMDIYVSATVGEELGTRGAKCVAYEVNPDYSISVDVTFGNSEGSSDKSFELSKGPTICISPSLSFDFTKHLMALCKEKEIPYQTETEGGNTGTNAWAVARNADNCRCALLSVPIRYMHSTCEVVNIKDIENAAKLIAAFCEEGMPDA
ncbi:MAG: M42 family peptidase [Clostridia bacterium]|nr:M42 family peptidase [Clostridia bacterium]